MQQNGAVPCEILALYLKLLRFSSKAKLVTAVEQLGEACVDSRDYIAFRCNRLMWRALNRRVLEQGTTATSPHEYAV